MLQAFEVERLRTFKHLRIDRLAAALGLALVERPDDASPGLETRRVGAVECLSAGELCRSSMISSRASLQRAAASPRCIAPQRGFTHGSQFGKSQASRLARRTPRYLDAEVTEFVHAPIRAPPVIGACSGDKHSSRFAPGRLAARKTTTAPHDAEGMPLVKRCELVA